MTVEQLRLITVIRDAVTGVEERFDGYRTELLDHVSQIVMLEREHEKKATQIQKKVSDKVAALGTLIARHVTPSS